MHAGRRLQTLAKIRIRKLEDGYQLGESNRILLHHHEVRMFVQRVQHRPVDVRLGAGKHLELPGHRYGFRIGEHDVESAHRRPAIRRPIDAVRVEAIVLQPNPLFYSVGHVDATL